MNYVSSIAIIDFFNKLYLSNIDYILTRNIDDELPNSLKIGKDIDLLLKYKDRKTVIAFLQDSEFKKAVHPHHTNVFLYGVNEFEFFINNENLLIDINYQLTCRSLNAGEWIPLDKEIQKSAWENRVYIENSKFSYYSLCHNDEFVTLITRCVFDKNGFSKIYIERIDELLEIIDEGNVLYKLGLIFFKYAPCLIEQVKRRAFNKIIKNYISFKDY